MLDLSHSFEYLEIVKVKLKIKNSVHVREFTRKKNYQFITAHFTTEI